MKRNKKKKIPFIIAGIIILVMFIIIIILTLYFYNRNNTNKDIETNVPQIKDNMDNYDYYLNDNATEYYETLYEELKLVLNEEVIDDSKFAGVISKLFITDVFTLNNKISSNDIGGLQFIHDNFKDDFLSIAKTTLYSTVESNIYGDRTQELPIVNNVEVIEIKEGTFKYNNIDNNSYVVSANIIYEKDLGYPNSYTLTLIKNDKYWQVVSGK